MQPLPLFPAEALAALLGADGERVLLPPLPEQPLALLGLLLVYIVTTEKHLFVQGFKPHEQEGQPPLLLRGCLVVRVLKPSRIRSVLLAFRGVQRLEWPEGIPPKRAHYAEINDIVLHTWPFYHMDTPVPDGGAHVVRPVPLRLLRDDVLHLLLSEHALLFAASLIKRATLPRLALPGLLPVSLRELSSVVLERCFVPGDYVYNFEHPLQALTPELISVNFGRVWYSLEATVERVGTFKLNLVARLPVEVVRIPSDSSVEQNEPIVIEREWEDQLRYEIVVGSKLVVLDTYVPLNFKFVPLFGKVALHRIRVFISENCNYYCNGKAVHRVEPTRKFLLLEHKAKKNHLLLLRSGGADDDDEVLPRELEFQMFVPSVLNKKYAQELHPDTLIENIQCDHWIKISLRISRQDTENPEKRKHFEIMIDSPIHLCLHLAAHCNTLLPAYENMQKPAYLPVYLPLPPVLPDVTPVDGLQPLIFLALGSPEFQHISRHADPIPFDDEIHLEANLYKPAGDAVGSPQATPFTPVGSPRLQPQPLLQPPAFEVTLLADHSLPPAYERSALLLNPQSASSSSIKESLGKQLSLAGWRDRSSERREKRDRSSTRERSGSTLRPEAPCASIMDTLKSHQSLALPAANAHVARTARLPTRDSDMDIADLSLSGAQHTMEAIQDQMLPLLAAELDEEPLDQTLPLLSTTKLELLRALFDLRSTSVFGLVADLVDDIHFDEHRVNGSLNRLRNPRIAKHYQEDPPAPRTSFGAFDARPKRGNDEHIAEVARALGEL